LMYECSFLRLLDLEPEEDPQLAHHAHLKFPAHCSCKPCVGAEYGPDTNQ
jgi:hypothetical protein